MAIESWAPVPSFPGVLASSEGRLMVEWQHAMRDGSVRDRMSEPSFGQWDGKRYVYPRRGKPTMRVARLVCEAFNGPPKDGQICMHLDENARNNRADNLRWGTQKENLNMPGFISYCKARTGENNPNVKGRKKRAEQAASA